MLKTGIISQEYFGFNDYKEGLKKLKDHGYDCMDYSEFMGPESQLYKMTEIERSDYLQDVANCAKNVGVEIVQLHGAWPTEDTTDAGRMSAIKTFETAIIGAHALNCKKVIVHPCLPFGWGDGNDKDFIYKVNYERYSSLLPCAEKYGVTVCIENLPFTAIDLCSVRSVKNLVRDINHPLFKICLDTGHSNVFKDDIAQAVHILGDDLVALHVHDNDGFSDVHWLPYKGTIDWDNFLSALKEISYKGAFTLETNLHNTEKEPSLTQKQKELSALVKKMTENI